MNIAQEQGRGESFAATSSARGPRWVPWAVVGWSALLSAWLARAWFVLPSDRIQQTEEQVSYVLRLMEFRDCLAHGYWSPQWCVHFWGGLGSPYFNYYQPGLFYVASAVPWSVSPVRAMGVAVFGFALAGYAGMFCLVRRWFDVLAAVLGATGLLLSSYVGTDLYFRVDVSEFAAMMLVPGAFAALAALIERGGWRRACLLAFLSAAIVVTHPCVALAAWGVLTAVAIGIGWICGGRRRVAVVLTALLGGVGLSAFYWLPVFTERHLVHAERITQGIYNYALYFRPWVDFVLPSRNPNQVPLSYGFILPAMAALNLYLHWCNARPNNSFSTNPYPASRKRRASKDKRRSDSSVDPIWDAVSRGQRLAAYVAVGMTLGLTWMMTSSSAWVWGLTPLLPLLQMPWRLFSVATVTLSLAAAAIPNWRRPMWRTAWIVAGLVAMCSQARHNAPVRTAAEALPPTAAEIAGQYFIPDVQSEWTPQTVPSELLYPNFAPPVATTKGPDDLQIEQATLSAGRISMRVSTVTGGALQLPHFYFKTGWLASLDGLPIDLQATENGFMQVELPPASDGLLEVQFTMTPARRRGWMISAFTVCLCVAALVFPQRPGTGKSDAVNSPPILASPAQVRSSPGGK